MKEPQLHTIIKDKMGVGWQRTPAVGLNVEMRIINFIRGNNYAN